MNSSAVYHRYMVTNITILSNDAQHHISNQLYHLLEYLMPQLSLNVLAIFYTVFTKANEVAQNSRKMIQAGG